MKKTFKVKCEVDMNASHTEEVVVRATKHILANQKAIDELRKRGFFHASVIFCEEVEENATQEVCS